MSASKVCPQCGTEYEADQRFCPRDGATLRSTTANDLVGEVVADRYLITQKLGEGGMGQVYLAEHVRMGRKSAVKVMNPGMVHDADAISRFNREASNASRINHPHVAAIYDFGETPEGVIYLAMEFVEGEPLTKLIARQGALPAARAAEIVRQAGDALAVAHDLGIVHRDLKPDNIMIARNRDGSDCVKIVDFGIAKAAGADGGQKVTKTGLVVGTPEFMSPEQLAGDPLDGRSDIYSLGLVAFNMMTGTLPFPSETVQESMIMRLTDRPRTLSEMRGDVAWPAEIQLVLDRALARDAKERYQSAADFGRDLAHAAALVSAPGDRAATMVVGNAPLPATRVSAAASAGATRPVTRVQTAKRRRTMPLALAAGAVALAVGVGAVATRARPVERAASHVPSSSLDSATTGPVAAVSTTTDSSATMTSGETVEQPAAADATTPGRREVTPPAAEPRVRTAAAKPTEAASVASALEAIASLAQEPATAPRALDRIGELLPQLRGHDDSVRALYHRAEAQLNAGDQEAGCATLARVGRMPPAKYSVASKTLFGLAACDP